MKLPTDERLIAHAAAAARMAYAPYSGFPVGAAAVTAEGIIFTGSNVENASYGLTVCAERVAVWTAVAAGCHRIQRIAIVAGGARPAWPCGACLQVLAEFGKPDMKILVATPRNLTRIRTLSLGDLLPHAFRLGPKR